MLYCDFNFIPFGDSQLKLRHQQIVAKTYYNPATIGDASDKIRIVRAFTLGNTIDRRIRERRDSLSTVTSSVAAELIRESEVNETQNNFRINGQQRIHIGDVINNIYTPPSDPQRGYFSDSDASLISNEKKKTFRFLKTWTFWVVLVLICARNRIDCLAHSLWLRKFSQSHANEVYLPRRMDARRATEFNFTDPTNYCHTHCG